MADILFSPLSVVVALVLGGALLLWVHHQSSSWRVASKSGARLPKGSMGWPIIGETLQFSKNPRLYGKIRVERYGRLFKSSLVGRPTIVGSTPEFAKFILTNPKIFSNGYAPAITRILGPKAFVTLEGSSRLSVKKIVTKPLMPDTLRTKVEIIEDIIYQHLTSWAKQGTVVATKAAEKILLDTALYLVIGDRKFCTTSEGQEMLEQFVLLNKALFSAPIQLPGTSYSKGLKAKERISAMIKSLLEERKRKGSFHFDPESHDVLGDILAAREDEEARTKVKDLSDDMIVDNIVLMLFGAFDATATSTLWVMKTMNDFPDVFRRLQAEQQEIRKEKLSAVQGQNITWDDIKKMDYTRKFFKEVQRYITIAALLAKTAKEDVEFEGHFIPKGWTVTPKPYTFLPFSTGAQMCPGADLAKVISSILVHHLCTTFTHESAAPDKGLVYNSFLRPVTGYPITVRRN